MLRLEAGPADPASIRWEHDLVLALGRAIPDVVTPIADLDGETFFVQGCRRIRELVSALTTSSDVDWDYQLHNLRSLAKLADE